MIAEEIVYWKYHTETQWNNKNLENTNSKI